MRVIQARDRLAVWTYEEAGEEIPIGDPSVSDHLWWEQQFPVALGWLLSGP
jgi:hypothetical protein